MSKSPSRELKQVLLRIPADMYKALERSREEKDRPSITAEVLARLASTFANGEEWLSQIQNSPSMRLERRLIAIESQLEARIEALEVSVNELKRQKQ